MLVKELIKIKDIEAGDRSILKEVLVPAKEKIGAEFSLAHAKVLPGGATLLHSLSSSEAYIIISGSGRMRIEDEEKDVEAGQVVYIPPDAKQKITNTGDGDLVFYCVVSPPWKKENEKISE